MAQCSWCKEDMNSVDDCAKNRVVEFLDGTNLPASTFHLKEPSGRCHDCGIQHGNFHHPGCDVEKCPRCGGQIISCGCQGSKSSEVE